MDKASLVAANDGQVAESGRSMFGWTLSIHPDSKLKRERYYVWHEGDWKRMTSMVCRPSVPPFQLLAGEHSLVSPASSHRRGQFFCASAYRNYHRDENIECSHFDRLARHQIRAPCFEIPEAAMSDDRHEWISKRAYGLWEEHGRQWGRDQEYWLRASSERDHMEKTRASPDGREVLARRDRLAGGSEPGPSQRVRDCHRKVLIVDDEPVLRFAAVSTLEEAGYLAMEAANASEALILLKMQRVDAVITDINMPGEMDGLGLAAKVRKLWPETRVIVTSGLVSLHASDIGEGVRFLSKPYEESALLGTLADAA